MGKIARALVEYNGIEKQYEKLDIFNQDNYDFIISIPEQKPDCEIIEKVWIDYNITHTEIMTTHKGISLEGTIATGKTLLIVGDIKVKIQYVGCKIDQSVHTLDDIVPFSGVVVLPKGISINEYIIPIIIIEDIYSTKIDYRCIYNNISILFSAEVY